MSILDLINSPDDLKKLCVGDLYNLSADIRDFLLDVVSKTGGHLASNLGVVELTVALHYCFCVPFDKIIWDVGHQCYVHKILTGRKNELFSLRQFDGLSGYPKSKESSFDVFDTGHSSTSISAALGMAFARDLSNDDNSVIAVIGDGSMTGGLAYEALNNAGRSNSNLIVVLNDNQMSISKNVGALSRHLNDIRSTPSYEAVKQSIFDLLIKVPVVGRRLIRVMDSAKDKIKYVLVRGILFEELGFKYIGPIDGHNIKDLINVLNNIKRIKGPILLHVYTTKGKGYKYAEQLPASYHGVKSFNIESGKAVVNSQYESYSDVFGAELVSLADENDRIVAVSAAMVAGTGLESFQKKFPHRLFDVGIAEGHAVTFSAGLSKLGYIPVFAVYSSFLQRGYDQILHDVALQNLHVVFAIDRAGIVGEDGETHQGIYDFSFLSHIPNLTIMSPKNKNELKKILEFAMRLNSPVAIRYPKGAASCVLSNFDSPIELGKMEVIEKGKGVAIISVGHMMDTALRVVNNLKNLEQNPTLINAVFIKPIDIALLSTLAEDHFVVFTVEDNIRSGGFGSLVLDAVNLNDINLKVVIISLPDSFIEHGSVSQLYLKYGLDADSVTNTILRIGYGQSPHALRRGLVKALVD